MYLLRVSWNMYLMNVLNIVTLKLYIHTLLTNLLNYYQVKEKIVSEYDQEIPQSQTADNPVASRGRAAQPSRDTRKTN